MSLEPNHPPSPTDVRRRAVRAGAVALAVVIVAGVIAVSVSRGGNHTPSGHPTLALTGPLADPGDAGGEHAASTAMPLGATPTYEFAAPLPDLGRQAPVWAVADPTITDPRVATWARTLGLDGRVERFVDGGQRGLRVEGHDGVLAVTSAPTPRLSYQRGVVSDGSSSGASGAVGPSVEPPSRAVDLPTEAETRMLGERTLRDLGVLDGTWSFTVRDGAGVAVATTCSTDGPCTAPDPEQYLTSRALVASRTVDGHAVSGADWTVEVGDHGVVDAVHGLLGELEPVGDAPLDAPRAALDRDISPSGPVPEPAIACAPGSCPSVRVTVNGVALGSAVWLGGRAGSRYVVPTYHFTGHRSDGTPWSHDVLALTAAALAPGLRDDASPPTIPAPIPGAIPGATKPCRTPNEICGGGASGAPTSGSAVP